MRKAICKNYWVIVLIIALLSSCEDSGVNEDIVLIKPMENVGAFTYKLSESPDAFDIWTSSVTNKIQIGNTAPENKSSGINICAAKNEFEPFQVILSKGNGTVTVHMEPFSSLGSENRVEICKVGFESGWAESLEPIENGAQLNLSSSQCTPLWITVYVPEHAVAGTDSTTLTLTFNNTAIDIPVRLNVFNFTLPQEIHFASQFNKSIGGEADHTLLYEHRLTPKSPTWPSGFSYKITWPSPYNAFYDEADHQPEYGIKYLAAKYLNGEGWLGSGYPNGMAFQFVDNNTPRPATFAGESIGGDQYGTESYNDAWKKYLSALNQYLVNNGYSDEVYYYVMNEPQGNDDYDLAAFLSNLTKQAAPNLRIAISEEPKAEICENDKYKNATYDIWIASLQHYDADYGQQRMQNHNEQVWFYSLPQDPDPFFNPTKVENQGIHQRIIPWVAWSERIKGWAYYNGAEFFDNGKPNIRLELLREGFEDYEYLYLANGGQYPNPNQTLKIDETVRSVATGLTNWVKDADALTKLKWELGYYIENGLNGDSPVLQAEVKRPKGAYYINFQDIGGEPLADPLVVDDNIYIKVGWEAYSNDNLYGWSGSAVGNNSRTKTAYKDVNGYTELEKSYLYDDYGHINTFEFDLENGEYEVTVGVGRPDKNTGDATNVSIEGVKFYDAVKNIASSEAKTQQITVADGSLTLTMGIILNGQGQYTFLSYLNIVPVE